MSLSILQAEWQLGLLRPEELPPRAIALLTAGVESPAMIELAGLMAPDRWDVAPVLERVFEELEIRPISDDAARWRIVYATARDIVERRVTPLEGARMMWGLATDLGLPESISNFVYLAADYGEGPGDPETERAWFDARIIESAIEVLQGERPDQPPLRKTGV